MKYTLEQAALVKIVSQPGEKMPPQKRQPNVGPVLLLITTLLLPRLSACGGEGVSPQPTPPQAAQTDTNTPAGRAGLSVRAQNGDTHSMSLEEYWQEEQRAVGVRAENGDTDAQCQLAISLMNTDDAAAVKWFLKAADAGNATAQCFLGSVYDEGWVAHENHQAVRWYRKNPQEALRWYRKSAEKGYAPAQFFLGAMYGKGSGGETNLQEAVEWFTLAAEQGLAAAQRKLGYCYYFGEGVPSNFVTSAKWLLRAAKQGNADAQCHLAALYFSGQGVPQDYVEAYKWINLAAVNGDSLAQQFRLGLGEHMTPVQIAEAQRRSSAFIAHEQNETSHISAEPSPALVPQSTGTAFFISGDGYLLTAAHVVEGATRIVVHHGGKKLRARLIKTDTANDLAVLKVPVTLSLDEVIKPVLSHGEKALPLAASRSVKLGDSIFTIGFPNTDLQGTEAKLTKGEISSMSGIQDDPRDFQISAPIQPGNSGGPLVDLSGNVVGMVTSRLADVATLQASGSLPQNVNYALKSSFIVAFLETLAEPSAKLKEPRPPKQRGFSEVVEEVKASVVLITVY